MRSRRSSAEFIALLRFNCAILDPEGTLAIYLTAADLFTDHAIRISVEPDGTMPYGAMLEA